MEVGDFITVMAAGSPNRTRNYIVSIDSETTLTLSQSWANATYDVEFFRPSASGLPYYDNFQPSSLLFANNTVWHGDARGFTLYYSSAFLNDVWIDETVSGSSGNSPMQYSIMSILHNHASAILDLGTTSFRKWVNGVIIKIRPRADTTAVSAVQPFGENDDNDYKQGMREIFSPSFYPWGTLTFGDPRLWMRVQKIVDAKRRFPKNTLRCDYKQLHIKSSFSIIIHSDTYGVATVANGANAATKTITIASGNEWPTNVYNYWISFETDDYTENYPVISRDSASQLTVIAPLVANGSNVKWVMRAYPVNNFLQLIEYSFLYEVLGPSQASYSGDFGRNSGT
jgi:hypothetical protein